MDCQPSQVLPRTRVIPNLDLCSQAAQHRQGLLHRVPHLQLLLLRVVEVQVVVRNVASGLQSRGGAKEELRASSFTLSTG